MADQLAKLQETVARMLGEGRPLELAQYLVSELSQLSTKDTSFLSYYSLSNLAHTKTDDPELLVAISVLTSDSAAVLKPFFVYLDETSNKEFILSPNEYTKATKRNYIVNPETGELDRDFYRHILPYFRTSDVFQKMVG